MYIKAHIWGYKIECHHVGILIDLTFHYSQLIDFKEITMVPAYEFDVAKMFHERLIGLIDEKKDEVYARSESKKEEIAPNRQMRSKRTPRKFTQKKIAEEMCINEKTFSSYISREKVPRVHEVVTIAQYFGVSTDYLLGISHSKEVEELPRKVREYTGLSDAAVETLLYYKSAKESTLIATINLLLEELGENKSTLDVLHEALSEPEDDSMYEFQFDESEIPEYPEEFYEQAYDEMQADFNMSFLQKIFAKPSEKHKKRNRQKTCQFR